LNIRAPAETLAAHRELPAAMREKTTGAAALAASQSFYLPLHEQEPYADIALLRDVRYGADERHHLDVFTTTQSLSTLRPVLLFVHGGGFTGGDKKRPGLPYQDNVGLWAARHGVVGVNMTYRLAPQHRWPAVVEDVAAAVAWAKGNVAAHGGDPARIFLMGASAGATHAASFIARQVPDKTADLAGGILVSGAYDLTLGDPGDSARSYFGDDASRHAASSPFEGLLASPVPLMVAIAEYDPPKLEAQALHLINAFHDRRKTLPAFTRLMGHNHFTTTHHLNTGDEYFGLQILRFMDLQAAE
jgi:triacylglycerol lipase